MLCMGRLDWIGVSNGWCICSASLMWQLKSFSMHVYFNCIAYDFPVETVNKMSSREALCLYKMWKHPAVSTVAALLQQSVRKRLLSQYLFTTSTDVFRTHDNSFQKPRRNSRFRQALLEKGGYFTLSCFRGVCRKTAIVYLETG